MKAIVLDDKTAYKTFASVGAEIYSKSQYFRSTEAGIERLLLNQNSAFKNHSCSKMFVVQHASTLVARFALIHDFRQPNTVQVSFFEAQQGLDNIYLLIQKEIQTHFPSCKKVIVGLNGHLNYGAGILLNRFDEAPLFGLPYNPPYYADYFKNLHCRKMFTFRFTMEAYKAWAQTYTMQREMKGLNVRFMNKRKIKEESARYTQLNNQAFQQHPYWANRDNAEDLELFYPFRFLLDNENLIFAELNGKPVGFFLWYPDFNQLVSSSRDLNIWDVIKYRLRKPIDTFRFTEIGIVPQFQRSPVALALIRKSLPELMDRGYKYCEGGFIFEENKASIAFVTRILKRIHGVEPEPYRQFAIFETTI